MERQRLRKRGRTPSAKFRAAAAPPPPAPVAPAVTASEAARPVEAGSGGGREEAPDEDVDRFFALLADVREMRELFRRNGGNGGGGGGDASKKRERVEDDDGGGRQQRQGQSQNHNQLWRPTFVMEDFAFELKGGEAAVQPEKKVEEAPNLDLSLSI